MYGTFEDRLWAIVLFTFLGFTDFIDGLLARKYGSTKIGAILDPLVDKIFIAAVYLILCDLGFISPILTLLLLSREFAVTFLRGIALKRDISFRTSEIAKYKTTIQMIGAAFILFVAMFQGSPEIQTVLALITIFAFSIPLIFIVMGKKIGHRSTVGPGFILLGYVLQRTLPYEVCLNVYMLVITFVTLFTGISYFIECMKKLAQCNKPLFRWEILYMVASSMVMPSILFYTFRHHQKITWVYILIFSFEFIVMSLETLLKKTEENRYFLINVAKIALQITLGAVAAFLLILYPRWGSHFSQAIVYSICALTFGYTLFKIMVHRNVLYRA
jgi:CDP-diacylglycerol--glycerol-3-phosphate 3-phosphatidyltransferase